MTKPSMTPAETREASAVDWENVPANNKALMIATVQNMLDTVEKTAAWVTDRTI